MTTSDLTPVPLGARNATLSDLARLLREQQARKVDIVAPATAIRAHAAQLLVDDSVPELGPGGVTATAGAYIPTEVCDQGIADKLGIPVAYAFLSDGYKIIDCLDVLMAALDGVRNSGFPVEIDGCDLTERRMYVRVVCEQVRVLASALLGGYRSPFTGASGADNPVVFAGFVITNSETGCGAFSLTPRLVVQVCRNGMTITRDALRAVHLGERLDEGVVTWSGNTRDKTLALITAKTTDAVATFLDPAYAERAVRAIEKDAGHPLAHPPEAVRVVSQRLRFTDAQQHDILAHFIRGGDVTAGGLMHAVTSAAQAQPDADTAHEMEAAALRALEVAAAL